MKKAGSGKFDVAALLSSAYGRVPQLPYLDRATSLILILCVAGYLGFTAYIFFTTPQVEIEARLLEGPLYKNSQLGILPGEHYAYLVEMPGQSQQVEYRVLTSHSCKGVAVQEQSGGQSQTLCIMQNGLLEGQGQPPNINYGNQSIILFSPWMLAASENFSWTVDAIYSAKGLSMTIPTYFASKGRQQMAGREAYEISVGDGTEVGSARFFIDSEKRVLLLADIGNSNMTIRMTQAPFALDWPAQSQ